MSRVSITNDNVTSRLGRLAGECRPLLRLGTESSGLDSELYADLNDQNHTAHEQAIESGPVEATTVE